MQLMKTEFTAKEMRHLLAKNNLSVLVRLAFIVTLYAIFSIIGLKNSNIGIVLLSSCVQGFLLVGLFSAFHDAVHYTLLSRKSWNKIVGRFAGVFLLNSFTFYRRYHITHHKYTGMDGDTEPHGSFDNIWQYVRGYVWPDFMIDVWRICLRALVGIFPSYVLKNEDRKAIQLETITCLLWLFAFIICLVIAPTQALKVYGIPYLFYLSWFFFTALPEHYNCEEVGDFRRSTRSVRSNRFFEFIYFNGNYHAEHHIAPGVPSCNLPILHNRLKEQLQNVSVGYLNCHTTIVRDLLSKRSKGAGGRNGNGISSSD